MITRMDHVRFSLRLRLPLGRPSIKLSGNLSSSLRRVLFLTTSPSLPRQFPEMHAKWDRFSWGWMLFAILVSIAIFLRTRSWYRLGHIPGPPSAAFSKLWLLRKTLGGRLHLDLAEACEKYGIVLILRTLRSIFLLISFSRLYCTNWSERAGDERF